MGRAVPAICISSRNCIGQAYAMVETKVVLAMLLASFCFGIFDTYAIVGNTGGGLGVRERKEAGCFFENLARAQRLASTVARPRHMLVLV